MTVLPDMTEAQIRRYARHIVLAEIGGVGQARLIAAKVLVVGAGGLGAPLLQYLAAATTQGWSKVADVGRGAQHNGCGLGPAPDKWREVDK
jgi:hypothetical protein